MHLGSEESWDQLRSSKSIPNELQLDTSELLTFPCCLPPRQFAQAGSPFVGALQNIFLFEICFLIPWQSHGRLLLKLSESHKSQ